jgi:hypothetical protein
VSSGVVGLAVGLLLCFFGVGSLHLAVLGSGFALGWLIAGLFNANTTTTVLVGLGCAVVAWVLVSLVFRFGAFFVGAVAGGVIGAWVFQLLVTGTNKALLTTVFVVAFAGVSGLLAARYRGRFLMWATALGWPRPDWVGWPRAHWTSSATRTPRWRACCRSGPGWCSRCSAGRPSCGSSPRRSGRASVS